MLQLLGLLNFVHTNAGSSTLTVGDASLSPRSILKTLFMIFHAPRRVGREELHQRAQAYATLLLSERGPYRQHHDRCPR